MGSIPTPEAPVNYAPAFSNWFVPYATRDGYSVQLVQPPPGEPDLNNFQVAEQILHQQVSPISNPDTALALMIANATVSGNCQITSTGQIEFVDPNSPESCLYSTSIVQPSHPTEMPVTVSKNPEIQGPNATLVGGAIIAIAVIAYVGNRILRRRPIQVTRNPQRLPNPLGPFHIPIVVQREAGLRRRAAERASPPEIKVPDEPELTPGQEAALEFINEIEGPPDSVLKFKDDLINSYAPSA